MELSTEKLSQVLRNAVSQNPDQFKPASQALKQSENVSGFHFHLLKVALMRSSDVEVNVRWLAALYLKNGIDHHWRHYGLTPINETEKNSIRAEILNFLDEPINQISVQMAVVVAKMARYDIPRYWPDLFPLITKEIGSIEPTNVSLRNNTILLCFRYIIKELFSKKLPNDRAVFNQIANSCFQQVFQLLKDFHAFVINRIADNATSSDIVVLLFDEMINITKALQYMWLSISKETQKHFFSTILSYLKNMLEYICSNPTSLDHTNLNNKVHKLLLIYSKIIGCDTDVYLNYASEVVALCQQCILLYPQNRGLFRERFVVNCMNQVKAVLTTASDEIVSLSDKEQLLRILTFSYLPLTQDDLREWEEDAEEFCSEEIGETWKYNLRPSAEVLFMTILHINSSHLVPTILSTLQTANENTLPAKDLNTILLNDAIYAAVGLAAIELFDALNFEELFVKHLLPLVQQNQNLPYGKILHRRVLRLIEQWISVKPPTEIRTILYNFIISSLESEVDLVVRLSAASALRQVLDEFEFDIGEFLPFQDRCTTSLYCLLKSVSTGDSKMRVLYVLSFVIEKLGPQVKSCVNQLAEMLPEIFVESESHNMLRCAIVVTLVNVVNALSEESVNLHPFLLNVIHQSTDINSPGHIYLLADGLELWIAVLQNATQLTDDLLRLFNNIYGLLEISSESLKDCFYIVECYTILGGQQFMGTEQVMMLSRAIQSLITDVRDECLIIVTRLVTKMIQVAPTETVRAFENYIHQTLNEVLHTDNWNILSTSRVLLIARLALHSIDGYWMLVEKHGADLEISDYFLKIFCDRLDNVVEIEQKKMVTLASLLIIERMSTDLQALSSALPRMLYICVQVLHDVCDEDKCDSTLLSSTIPKSSSNEWENTHSFRIKALMYNDPVHKVSLLDLTRQQLSVIQACFENFNTFLMEHVDQETLKDLKMFLG